MGSLRFPQDTYATQAMHFFSLPLHGFDIVSSSLYLALGAYSWLIGGHFTRQRWLLLSNVRHSVRSI